MSELKALLVEDDKLLRPLVQLAVQEFLEAEMNDALGAGKGERCAGRLGYRSGHYPRKLITRVGTLELRVPQDRQGRFSTEPFSRYQRIEKALVAALVEMYVQGVSTRKIKAISEELCGHEFSASTISELNATLDAVLERFARQPLEAEYPYLILDARYEKVREDGVTAPAPCWWPSGSTGRAAAASSGSNWPPKRAPPVGGTSCLASNSAAWRGCVWRSSTITWAAVAEILPEAAWQRCYVHFLRNALDHLPRKADDDCLTELRWLYDRRDAAEARLHLHAWLGRWAAKYPRLCARVEDGIEETWTLYRQPREHHKHLKSTNLLKRRTHVVRIFPHEQSCLRLIRALACEQRQEWLDGPV